MCIAFVEEGTCLFVDETDKEIILFAYILFQQHGRHYGYQRQRKQQCAQQSETERIGQR